MDVGVGLGPNGLEYTGFDQILNIDMQSVKAFPNFIMDWVQRQVDEIVTSLADLPDVRVVWPQFGNLTDPGWMQSLGG